MSENNHDGRRPRLRGGITYTAEDFKSERDETDRWRNTYRAQAKARDDLRAEKMRAGGDEDVYHNARIMRKDMPEIKPVRFSASGLLLDVGIHRISGPPGLGKTRLGYWEVLQRVAADDQSWMILDAEMGAGRYLQTMKQLGAKDGSLDNIFYMDYQEFPVPDLIENGRALGRVVDRHGYHGVLIDSQLAFLGASLISENDAHEVRNWIMTLTGIPCVIILDHTGHINGERGRGTSEKAAGCDVDLVLKKGAPFKAGQSGSLTMTVNKDRSGTLLTTSVIDINVECYGDTGMGFKPISWYVPDEFENELTVAEALDIFLIDNKRDYALSRELLDILKGAKQDRLRKIQAAVDNGDVIREKTGREIRYSTP